MRGIGVDPGWGITIVRVMTGLVFAVHGYEKVVGGLDQVAAGFGRMGIPTPHVMGPLVAFLELLGGMLLIVGLGTRLLGLLFAIQMAVATFWVKIPAQGWNASDLDRMLLAAGLLLFLAGPGRAALDRAWSRREPERLEWPDREPAAPLRRDY
ncbi:MAG: DoxX family protein [Candidatus Rokuibacteriota bacterium]